MALPQRLRTIHVRPTFSQQPRSWCCLEPFKRQVGESLQALNGEICGLVPGNNRLDDFGAETGERQKSADLCWIAAFIGRKSFQRKDLPGDQLLHPLVGSSNDVEEMLVAAWR